MQTITFDYGTNLCRCMGCSVGSDVTIELSDEEVQLFKKALDYYAALAPEDLEDEEEDYYSVYDMRFHFMKTLPATLAEKICNAINTSFDRYMAEEALYEVGDEIFEDQIAPKTNITYAEWREMDKEKKIDLILEYEPGNLDYSEWEVVDIEMRN